jgi:hypothetical protein
LTEAIDAYGESHRLLLHGTCYPAGALRDHGMSVQLLTDTSGELAFPSQARTGSTHDLTAARLDGIVAAVTDAEVEATGDSATRAPAAPGQAPEGQSSQRMGESELFSTWLLDGGLGGMGGVRT